jgi:L-gulonate 3-dehydrogenase
MTERVAIIGTGLIGRAWAVAFARGGCETALWDPTAGAVETALTAIEGLLVDLAGFELLSGQVSAAVRARLTGATSLDEAVASAGYVQESAPEQLDLKRRLWAELDRAAGPETVLASSTSALLPSAFTEDLAGRARCLVAHPINPPYLVPAVEIVPAPWTDATAVERTRALMAAIGQTPMVMRREAEGFIMNRLQAALVNEALRLVANGCCGVEDVDRALRDGIGLRWSFLGPFEVGDLNAPGGVRDYLERYRDLFAAVEHRPLPPAAWDAPLLGRIEAERRARLPAAALAARQRWRDRRLMALLAHKREAARVVGD